VIRPRVAVDAPVLAASIRIDARVEADIRAVVVSNERAGSVFEELSLRSRFVRIGRIRVAQVDELLKPIRRII
jgi:hypothetical protein